MNGLRESVLLVQRSGTDYYPPTLNQANILAEAGLRVILLDGGMAAPDSQLNGNVRLVRPLWQSAKKALSTSRSTGMAMRAARAWRNIVFTRRAWELDSGSDMQARIGYDSSGIMALKWHLDKRRFTVHHYHDYLGYGERERLWSGVQDIMAARRSQGANLVVVPDKHRKEFMQNLTPLKNARIEVVNNCPRRVEVLPRGRLRRDLRKLGVDAKHIVFFQGVVCSNYYAERIVESVRWWPDDAVMVFLGRVDESFRRELAVIAGRAGVSKRVIFLGHLTYKNVFSYTVDADLAFGMPKPVSLNFKYMAGASNKRFEYMACGVPQISNAEPGVKELIDLNGIGVSVNAEKPRDIAEAVKGLLGDEKRRRTMSEKARKLHLTLYNYDVQYRPVLDAILGGTSLKRVGRS